MVSWRPLSLVQLFPALRGFDNAAQTFAVEMLESQLAAALPGTCLAVKPDRRSGNVDFALMLLEEMNTVLSGCTPPPHVEPG